MTILIDADGCPVVDIAVKAAREHNVACVILCDAAHIFSKPDAVTITVSTGRDSVDFALVNRIAPGDIVITQDYGLAAMCLAKRAVPLNQNGLLYTNDNIDALLNERHMARKQRMSGGRYKGPSKRTAEQDLTFEQALVRLLTD